MKINTLVEYLSDLENASEKKSEKRTYGKMIILLESLESKKLDENNIIKLEKKLDELDITSIKGDKYRDIRSKFIELSKFLEKEFNLIEEDHYLSLGMIFGMLGGLVLVNITGIDFGIFNQTSGGLIGGMLIGMFVGAFMDKKAKDDDRVLETKKETK